MDKYTVFWDCETGGLDPSRHQITEIGAVAVDDRLDEIDHFEVKVQVDEKACTKEALDLVGYTPERWKDAKSPRQAMQDFSGFLHQYACLPVEINGKPGEYWQATRLAGYNIASFDLQFIRNLFGHFGAFFPGSFQVLDTYMLALWWSTQADIQGERPENLKLATLYRYLTGQDLDGAHGALADTRATLVVTKQLIRRMTKEEWR